MAFFMVSPSVEIREIDMSLIIPSVSTAIGALAGDFQWGPVNEIVNISNKKNLETKFGRPNDDNFMDWFSASSFLNYSNNLRIIRADQDNAFNAVANGSSPNTVNIKNDTNFDSQTFTSSDGMFVARYPGKIGNSLKISYCLANSDAFESWVSDDINFNQYFSTAPGTSEYCEQRGLSNDELHVILIDEDGLISGTPGTILERYEYISLCPGARRSSGVSAYIGNVLYNESDYIYWIADDDNFALAHAGKTAEWMIEHGYTSYYSDSDSPYTNNTATYSFEGGATGDQSSLAQMYGAYEPFANTTEIDITLLIAGRIPSVFIDAATYCNNLIALAERRHDSVAFVSPPTTGTYGSVFYDDATKAIEFANELTSSSFGVIDSCAIKVYDQYNAVYRWIPANGSVAGICAYTDAVAEPWYSPAGYSRGQLKSIAKISYNPDQFDRDDLYKARINPIVQFPGEGTILYGDKTLLARPSAFDRINVRRLFNVLEKAISTFAKYMLFEFNDEFTRARFVNIVSPYLREVQGRRGINSFLVVCDERNNTPQIIDANEFVADIYIAPARSINFMRLNFISTPTGVNFEELITGEKPAAV